MNSDMLLNRIRMAQQGLIGVHKKLYTLEHLLPSPDPAQFAETAKSAALLSERSTASLRGFLFTTTGGMPEGYYQQAAAAQGIKLYRFYAALELHKRSGIIVCFDFQEDALRPFCGSRIKLQTIDFSDFERRFLNSP